VPGLPLDEWTPGPDGRLWRRAARVLWVRSGEILLVNGRQPDSGRFWWTPGGGIAPGESDRDAAVRELAEEAGVALPPDGLVGPVARWDNAFTYLGHPVRQRDVFFWSTVEAGQATTAWTSIENATVDALRWVPVDEIGHLPDPLYPPQLPALIDRLGSGWDGSVMEFDPAR
jgi:ADP-ribose pyrophosphatase YjhB (NUDIX family)